MTTTISISLLLLVALLLIVSWYQYGQRQCKKEQALILLTTLKRLIGKSQKHRGLCAAYLQGNKASEESISMLRQELKEAVYTLNTSDILKENARWIGFVDHWKRLETNVFSYSVATSFKQHTHLIENLLYLYEDVMDTWQKSHVLPKHLSHHTFLWREFPLAVEFIGQARAVGMAVSTSRTSSQIDKVKLGYLHNKIKQLSSEAMFQLKAHNLRAPDALVSEAHEYCETFVRTIHDELIARDDVVIDSDVYFALASQSMDLMNSLLDKIMSNLIQPNTA